MSSDNHDTKPTIETVLQRINELGTMLETRLDSLEARIGGLEARMGTLENAVTELREEMHRGFRDLERRVETISIDMVKLRGDMRYVHERIDKIEKAG
ncbi:MAG TPA: hypothetical protein VKA70_13410 [Blastocatellia bacterium]|nr:hypothetical protein [Blastocatellia bacterium]